MPLDTTKLNDAEKRLLETLTANRNATADLEGVRGKPLLSILREVGIEISDRWLRFAERLMDDGRDDSRDGVDYEALILDRQGEQFGTTDSY